MKNPLFDFLDEVDGLPPGSTTANIEKEKARQGYGEKKLPEKLFSKKENVNGKLTTHFSK